MDVRNFRRRERKTVGRQVKFERGELRSNVHVIRSNTEKVSIYLSAELSVVNFDARYVPYYADKSKTPDRKEYIILHRESKGNRFSKSGVNSECASLTVEESIVNLPTSFQTLLNSKDSIKLDAVMDRDGDFILSIPSTEYQLQFN